MVYSDSCPLIDNIKHADPSKYRIHDVLILKHFPDADVHASDSNVLRNSAIAYARLEAAPPQVPWPLPPPRPREELEAGIEEWRAAALRVIDARLGLYNTNALASQASVYTASTASTGASAVRGSPHRVLGINELLEKILRDLAPSAQHAAWNVSVTWRRMMAYILLTSYRDPYHCSAVEHG
jgi:hypothetical protein